jgi:hypothetical protein
MQVPRLKALSKGHGFGGIRPALIDQGHFSARVWKQSSLRPALVNLIEWDWAKKAKPCQLPSLKRRRCETDLPCLGTKEVSKRRIPVGHEIPHFSVKTGIRTIVPLWRNDAGNNGRTIPFRQRSKISEAL